MSKIRLLPEHVVPHIAAGEVVERPSSVVKELVENAIDVRAENITIELEGFGFEKIIVADDGEGMDKEDLLQCFLPHTTSKIYDIEDLSAIKTLGFRGEALSSICAVSNVKIRSKMADEIVGHEVEIEYGEFKGIFPIAMSRGTVIQVENLFDNVPARKKFLKSDTIEYSSIVSLVAAYALLDKLAVQVSHNGKTILQTTKEQNITERMTEVLRRFDATDLIQIISENEHLRLYGYVFHPQINSRNSRDQYLFVNNRNIENSLISKTVKNAYRNILPPDRSPKFVLFVDVNCDLVDVNIHPRKEKVKFWDETYVTDFIGKAISESLEKYDLTFTRKGDYCDYFQDSTTHLYQKLKDSVETRDFRETAEEEIIQIANTYLAFPVDGGLMLIDQHAAHESILYDQYLAGFDKTADAKQAHFLETPYIFNVTPAQAMLFSEKLDMLIGIGFEIEPFGENTYRITAVPEHLKEHDYSLILDEYTQEELFSADISVDEQSRRTIQQLACKSAVKAGDYLTQEQRQALVKQMLVSKDNYTCPHGRPAKMVLTLGEMHRLFNRRN